MPSPGKSVARTVSPASVEKGATAGAKARPDTRGRTLPCSSLRSAMRAPTTLQQPTTRASTLVVAERDALILVHNNTADQRGRARPQARNSIARDPPDSRAIRSGKRRPAPDRTGGRSWQGRKREEVRSDEGMYRRTEIGEGSRRRRRRSSAAARRWVVGAENAKGRCGGREGEKGGGGREETSSGPAPIYRAVDMDRTAGVGRAHAHRW